MTRQPLLWAPLAIALLAQGGGALAAPRVPLDKLAWLGGCWQAEGEERGSGEQWLPPAGESMFGVSRTVHQGRTVGYEFMRIAPDADGTLTFYAQPSGKPPSAFPVRNLGDTEVVFENLEHGFPQRIIYRAQPPAGLHARIEGVSKGAKQSIDFPMLRVSCDAQLASPAARREP